LTDHEKEKFKELREGLIDIWTQLSDMYAKSNGIDPFFKKFMDDLAILIRDTYPHIPLAVPNKKRRQ
jgi:hypothetical protein